MTDADAPVVPLPPPSRKQVSDRVLMAIAMAVKSHAITRDRARDITLLVGRTEADLDALLRHDD